MQKYDFCHKNVTVIFMFIHAKNQVFSLISQAFSSLIP